MRASTASSRSASSHAGLVALGFERADPIVGIAITLVILNITWSSWKTIRHGIHEHDHVHEH